MSQLSARCLHRWIRSGHNSISLSLFQSSNRVTSQSYRCFSTEQSVDDQSLDERISARLESQRARVIEALKKIEKEEQSGGQSPDSSQSSSHHEPNPVADNPAAKQSKKKSAKSTKQSNDNGDEIASRQRDPNWRERYGMEDRESKLRPGRKSTKRSDDTPDTQSVDQDNAPKRGRGRPRQSDTYNEDITSSVNQSNRSSRRSLDDNQSFERQSRRSFDDDQAFDRKSSRSSKQSAQRARSPLIDHSDLAPVKNRFELEHDVEFVDEPYDPELDTTFQSINQSTRRSADDRFPDIVSPRSKLRGKGIAGASMLQRHLAHSEGVIETPMSRSSNRSSVRSPNQPNDPTVNRTPSSRIPVALRSANPSDSNQSNAQSFNQSSRSPYTSRERPDTRSAGRSSKKSFDQSDLFDRFGGAKTSTFRFERYDQSFDNSTKKPIRQPPPPSWENRFGNRHPAKKSAPRPKPATPAQPYESLLKEPKGTVTGFDSWIADMKTHAQLVVDKRSEKLEKDQQRKSEHSEKKY